MNHKNLMFERNIDKLKEISKKAIAEKKYEKSLAAMNATAYCLHVYSQTFADDEIENEICKVSANVIHPGYDRNFADSQTVLFYDSYGFDLRGLTIIYLKALINNGYRVIYVTGLHAKGRQPELIKETQHGNIQYEYIPMKKSHLLWIKSLVSVFEKYKPRSAFFYATPFDVTGAVVFRAYGEIVNRYLIDLTDHMFWVGKQAVDYILEFRNYGAYISTRLRGIEKNKLMLLPYYPIIPKHIEFDGFPFDVQNKKIIFSGGTLSKTHGEDGNSYYVLVDKILSTYPNVIFWYAGTGDDRDLQKLICKYLGRVYHTPERKDLFQVLKHVDLYLNTHPIGGALMTQYAIEAEVVPVTYKESGLAGLLLRDAMKKIMYFDMKVMINDIGKLLYDSEYKASRLYDLEGSVVNETAFNNMLKGIVSGTPIGYKFDNIEDDFNPDEFSDSFLKKLDSTAALRDGIARRVNNQLLVHYPDLFISQVKIKCKKRMFRK